MVSAMFFILRTGIPWRDLPAHFGPWSSVFTNTYNHRAVIEACARRRLSVMVEKSLATTIEDARPAAS